MSRLRIAACFKDRSFAVADSLNANERFDEEFFDYINCYHCFLLINIGIIKVRAATGRCSVFHRIRRPIPWCLPSSNIFEWMLRLVMFRQSECFCGSCTHGISAPSNIGSLRPGIGVLPVIAKSENVCMTPKIQARRTFYY